MFTLDQLKQIKYPNVTDIIARELPSQQIYQKTISGRWTAFGVLDGSRNIMISTTFDNAQDAVDALVDFARELKRQDFS